MKRFGIRLYLLLPALVALSACNIAAPTPAPVTAAPTAVTVLTDPATATAEAVAATPAEPAEAQALPSPTATASPTPEATATSTPVPATPSPTPEPPSPTPDSRPMLTVDAALTAAVNVRSGPGTNYSIVGQLQPGQSALITGRSEDSSWWQINMAGEGEVEEAGWIYGQLVTLAGDNSAVAVAEAPPPPTPAPEAAPAADPPTSEEAAEEAPPPSAEELEDQLRCGKDFCVTYQAMVPIWENGGCIGNHSIYITVLEGPPPGRPMDGVVIGDTFNNVEVASGDKGPGQTEITLWMNSMSVTAKRHIDGTPFTSEESFNFTSHDELIPAEVLAANGYCESSIEKCRVAQQTNNVCRGHYSWRVTFHKFD